MLEFDGAMFDLDGTLLSSMRYWRLTTLEFLLSRDIFPTQEEMGRMFYESGHILVAELVEKYGLGNDWDEVYRTTEHFMHRHYREDVQPKRGAAEFLEKLRAKGIRMCVGTASLREYVDEALTRLGLRDYFEFITDNRELEIGKDDPEFFRRVAERLGVTVSRMCVFEDAPYAIRGARAALCPVIGLLDPTQKAMWDEVIQLSDIAVHDYCELMERYQN